MYDDLILVPGILLLVRYRDELLSRGGVPRALALVGLGVLLWPWIAALGLIALRPLMPAATFDSTPVFSLPIRTAASLPFAVLALLALSWKIKLARNPESV